MKAARRPSTVSSNTVVRNEIRYIEGLIRNLLDARVDQIVLLDGGSSDGTWEVIQAYAAQYSHILPLRWPQPSLSEYQRGFKEVPRRNLMIDASEAAHIFYIDADERVSIDFKQGLRSACDGHVIEVTHFWQGRVRMSTPQDAIWTPSDHVRIFANDGHFRFASHDPKGLHNHLSFKGVPVKLARHRGALVGSALTLLYGAIGLRIAALGPPHHMYHYHYHDLSHPKPNDLRSAEFDWPIRPAHELVSSAIDPRAVYCADPGLYADAQLITERYYTPWAGTASRNGSQLL